MKFTDCCLVPALSIYFFLLMVSIPTACSIKIISINPSEDEISMATLSGISETFKLPNNFICCFSHLESSLDGNSFFTIYGENGSPWLSLSIWANSGGPFLWGMHNSTWLRIIEMKDLRPISWIHTCMQVAGKYSCCTFIQNLSSKNIERFEYDVKMKFLISVNMCR